MKEIDRSAFIRAQVMLWFARGWAVEKYVPLQRTWVAVANPLWNWETSNYRIERKQLELLKGYELCPFGETGDLKINCFDDIPHNTVWWGPPNTADPYDPRFIYSRKVRVEKPTFEEAQALAREFKASLKKMYTYFEDIENE
jgi:hypothetical protein